MSCSRLLRVAALAAAMLTVVQASGAQVPECGDGACPPRRFIDVHELGPGNVTADAVAEAHERDLAVQDDHDVAFERYWVDETSGRVYCLSTAPNAEAVTAAHREAHGLLPTVVHEVSEGEAAALRGHGRLFLDIHELGAGNVTADAVAEAHERDLAVQDDHDVHFAQYWVDERSGFVMCLSEAPDVQSIRATHDEAHGLLPDRVLEVVQGE